MFIFAKTKRVDLKDSFDIETKRVVIFAGSTYTETTTPSFFPHLQRLRNEIIDEYCENGKIIKDIPFNLSGSAGGVLTGSSVNGLDFFREEKTGKTINEFLGLNKKKQISFEEKSLKNILGLRLIKLNQLKDYIGQVKRQLNRLNLHIS